MKSRLQKWIKDLEKSLKEKDDSQLAWPFNATSLIISVESVKDLLDMLKEIDLQLSKCKDKV